MKTLRELRELSGLTQLELAKRAPIERTKLSLAEGGYVHLSAAEEKCIRAVLFEAARERIARLEGALATTT